MPYTAESMCEVIDRVFAGTDVVIAVRNRSYHSRLSPMRKMMSYGSKLLNRIFLNIRHTDTQGGLKGLSPRARAVMPMTVTLGFDVEEFDFPLERGRGIDFGTQLAVSSEGLEFLLDLLARLELRATFYTTANFALHRTDLVRRIVAGGHEVASHDYYHGLTAGSDPAGSRRTLEELTGQRIVGYRAPRLAAASSAALAAAGYRYNSSINPTWIPTRYNNLRAPCSVSREEGLTIYPVSVSAPFRVPLFWISLHVMPLPLYKLLCRSALRRDGHLNLYFHPWEFSARLREPAFGVPGYLTHCSGTDLQRKFIRLLEWLKARGCRFLTTREYLGCDE